MLPEENEVMTMAEVVKKYPGKWIAARVIDRDESAQPVKVELLDADLDIYTIRNKIGLDGVCTFFTAPIPEVMHVVMF